MKKRAKISRKITKKEKPQRYPVITPEERLEHLIRVSLAADTGRGSGVDEFFQQQAARLTKELEDLRKK